MSVELKGVDLTSDSDIHRAIDMLEREKQIGSLSDRDWANLCSLYDRLKDTENLKRNLRTPACLSSDDFEVWYAFGFLHRKLSFFGPAADCFERALAVEPRNVEALLGIGYCYEGLKDFDAAIASVERALAIVTSGTDEDRKRWLPELHHALGHFYIGRSRYGPDGARSLNDRDKGDQHMRLAVELDPSYTSCLAGIHCETRRYEEAAADIARAILQPEMARDDVLYAELHFYRGDAHRGLEQYDAAVADFDYVERFANEHGDRDVAAHARLFKVRTFLQRRSLDQLSEEEIETYLSLLLEDQPSEYAILSFREERERMMCILRGLLDLKVYVENEDEQDDHLKLAEIVSELERIVAKGRPLLLPVIVPGDIQLDVAFPDFVAPLLFRFDQLFEGSDSQSLTQCDVWLVVLPSLIVSPADVGRAMFRIGRYVEAKTVIFYDELGILDEEQGLGPVRVERMEDAVLLATFALLYDRVRRYVAEPEVPVGLTPFATAPAPIVAQTGTLPLL